MIYLHFGIKEFLSSVDCTVNRLVQHCTISVDLELLSTLVWCECVCIRIVMNPLSTPHGCVCACQQTVKIIIPHLSVNSSESTVALIETIKLCTLIEIVNENGITGTIRE